MRVSTAGQSFDLQRDAIAKAGCERVYDDTCSGRATERPGLARALEVARAGMRWSYGSSTASGARCPTSSSSSETRRRHRRVKRGPYLGPPFRCYPEAVPSSGLCFAAKRARNQPFASRQRRKLGSMISRIACDQRQSLERCAHLTRTRISHVDHDRFEVVFHGRNLGTAPFAGSVPLTARIWRAL